jgi:protein required for attachment to host cells
VMHAEEQSNPADRDQKTDTAGKAPSQGGSGATMEEVNFHQQEEDRFAVETAKLLQKRAQNGDYDKLIVVAPPRTLGELRKHYHKDVSDRLEGELAKDLTGHPVAEIEKILGAAE